MGQRRWLRSLGLAVTGAVTVASALSGAVAVHAANMNSHNVAYVFDDTAFPCGSWGCGMNDTRGPGSGASIFVNALTGLAPGTGNTGSYTPAQPGATVNLTNVPLSTLDSTSGALGGYDTAIIYQTCSIGTAQNAPAMAAINSFVEHGGKLMVFDADACASIANGPADWSTFVFPFATNSPGPEGASGSYVDVQPSSLTTGLSTGVQPGDSVGDANVFTTFDGAWFRSITAQNLNTVGIVEAYARTASGGLAVYEGEDFWFTFGPSAHLRLVFDNILNQGWNPDGLPSNTSASGITLSPVEQSVNPGGTATVTASVADLNGNPVSGTQVSFDVTAGPDAGASGSGITAVDGTASFSYAGATSGTDTLTASFTDSAGQVHTSNAVTVSFGQGSRNFVFVHGINGNFLDVVNHTSFTDLLDASEATTGTAVNAFAYYQDKGWQTVDPTTGQAVCTTPPPPDTTIPVYVDPNSIDPNICDSKSALGLNAAVMDQFLNGLQAPVTVMAHSMGGAITRGWLTYAQNGGGNWNGNDPALDNIVDSVVFLEGAQQGSYLATAGAFINKSGFFMAKLLRQVIAPISKAVDYDITRPGVQDLAGDSPWYRSVNPTDVPQNLHYYNFYTDIQPSLEVNLLFWSHTIAKADIGDLVMLPGTPNPTDHPLLGGARFLPGGSDTADRHEYETPKPYSVNVATLLLPGGPIIFGSQVSDAVYKILTDPANHLNIGKNIGNGKVLVDSCRSGAGKVTPTDEIVNILQDPASACA